MLFDIDSSKQVTSQPYLKEFNIWRKRLSQSEFDAIVNKLDSMIDSDEIHTAGWMPGNNWKGTVFKPIYTKACGMNEQESGLCFGLFVWYVFQNRPDEWYSGKFENGGVPIKSRTYFRKKF
ncbi:MAG: hypothetical protein KJ799_00465 [Bacteroidetes bacterium]|nr:hypothetical protein [Bacteroidota bacterium]MBU1680831.1 hypothetical protein [Bacteroidota bacterium]MBU2505194.1 hypothetical protein [Bacteroidota bacterium]